MLDSTLTKSDAMAVGGVLGGMLATYGILALVICVLLIIAMWKIFVKAGEPGWKSIIPIYNVYILCKIIGLNFWIYVLAIPVGLGILSSIAAGTGSATFVTIVTIATAIYSLYIAIVEAIKLGDAFGKSTAFKVCLFFFTPICYLILGFGKDKYVGKKAIAKK
jgi:hypothetical protein